MIEFVNTHVLTFKRKKINKLFWKPISKKHKGGQITKCQKKIKIFYIVPNPRKVEFGTSWNLRVEIDTNKSSRSEQMQPVAL